MKKVSDLKAWELNPRKISENSRRILKKGVDQFGDLSGIIYNRRLDRLIGGHQRSQVLNPEDTITIETNYDPPTEKGTVAEGFVMHCGEKYRYREVDFSEEEHAAASTMANNAGGEWDWSMLAKVLSELDANGFEDMELAGFSDLELEKILGGPVEATEMPELKTGDREPFQQMAFILHDDQVEQVKTAMQIAKNMGSFDSENENSNGNALARICEIFITSNGNS